MASIVVYNQEDVAPLIQIREGETKLGERISYLQPGEGISHLQKHKDRGITHVLLGIPESIGTLANLGKCCTDHGWEVFLKAFSNMQSNRFLSGEAILCLGEIKVKDLNEKAQRFSGIDPDYISKLRNLCSELDNRVYPVIESIVAAGLIPVIIGGGHNNAYPILKGVAHGLGIEGLQSINCDPHADLRRQEGRHSGNGFSYAFKEGYLKRYFVLGLHENSNSEYVLEQLIESPNSDYSPFDPILSISEHIQKAIDFIGRSNLPLGLEVDMDGIVGMPASAAAVSGFQVEEARKIVQEITSKIKPVYLHLPEAAPAQDTADEIKVGMTLAYLGLDFLKS